MRALKLGVAAFGLWLAAGCGEDTGLLDLTLTPDPQAPPAQGTTVELAGSGGILRSYVGTFPPDGGTSLRLQYPDLPARDITFSVRVRDASGCIVGESPAPFQVRIEAGQRVTAAATVRRSSSVCSDGGIAGLDGGAGIDAGLDAMVDLAAIPDIPALDLQVPDRPTIEASSIDTPASVDVGAASADVPLPGGPIIISFTANPATISVGSGTTLTAVFANGTGNSVDHGIGSLTTGNGVSTGPLTTPTTYKLTVTGADGQTVSQTATVTVVPLPTISSFTALLPAVAAGTLTQVTAVFSGGAGTVDNGLGAIDSGSPLPTPVVRNDTTFTLTVKNAAGDAVTSQTTVKATTPVGPNKFTSTGSPTVARVGHTATLLGNGKVLVLGGSSAGAELYDPASGRFTPTAALPDDPWGHTATLLRNGKVLVASGRADNDQGYARPFLYDPSTGGFEPTGDMVDRRSDHTATLLQDGRVLIAGGSSWSNAYLSTAELYDPATGTFSQTGQMSHPRTYFTANLLPDGQVLVAGGRNITNVPPTGYLGTADTWDPATGRFTPTGMLFYRRCVHAAVTLANGRVLLVGGVGDSSGEAYLRSAEVYDPGQRAFSTAGNLVIGRYQPGATLLPDGRVLVLGTKFAGNDGADGLTTEVFIPNTTGRGEFIPGPNMTTSRGSPSATLLPNGAVLVVEGTTADLYW